MDNQQKLIKLMKGKEELEAQILIRIQRMKQQKLIKLMKQNEELEAHFLSENKFHETRIQKLQQEQSALCEAEAKQEAGDMQFKKRVRGRHGDAGVSALERCEKKRKVEFQQQLQSIQQKIDQYQSFVQDNSAWCEGSRNARRKANDRHFNV